MEQNSLRYLDSEIRDYRYLVTILYYMSVEQVCIAISILVLLKSFSVDIVLTKLSLYQFVLSESVDMKQNFSHKSR